MNNKKISNEIAIGVILLIAVLIGGAFYIKSKKEASVNIAEFEQSQAQNQQNSTRQRNSRNDSADSLPNDIKENIEWKIFKNDAYKFEIQYPSNFIFNENQVVNPLYSIAFGLPIETNQNSVNASRHFEISIYKNDTSLENFVAKANNAGRSTERNSEIISTEKISNFSAKVVKTCDMGGNCSKIDYLTDGKKIYSIYLENYFTSDEANKEVADRMLASFKLDK